MKPRSKHPPTSFALTATLFVIFAGCGGIALDESPPAPDAGFFWGPGAGLNRGNADVRPAACDASPAAPVQYSTAQQLDALLLRRWRRCTAPQIAGEDVGVEFASNGRYYALGRDYTGVVVRVPGTDKGGTWTYGPPGSIEPGFSVPSPDGYFVIDEVGTSPPTFTANPVQMQVLFSPVPSRYVPLDP